MIISLGSSGKVFPAPIQLHWCLLLFSLFVSFIFGFSLSELNPELDGYAKMHWQKWHKMLPNGLTKISLGGIYKYTMDSWFVGTFSSKVKCCLLCCLLQSPLQVGIVLIWFHSGTSTSNSKVKMIHQWKLNQPRNFIIRITSIKNIEWYALWFGKKKLFKY